MAALMQEASEIDMCASSTVCSDGTLYSCTSLYAQLGTLHADVDETVGTLCLLSFPTGLKQLTGGSYLF